MKKNLNISLIISIFCSVSLAQNKNQNELSKSFDNDNYLVFKVEGDKISEVSKKWETKIYRSESQDGQGNKLVEKVEVNRSGVILETFTPDVALYPAYFGMGDNRLTFLNEYLIYYIWRKEQAEIKYVLCQNCKKPSFSKLKTNLEQYVLETL